MARREQTTRALGSEWSGHARLPAFSDQIPENFRVEATFRVRSQLTAEDQRAYKSWADEMERLRVIKRVRRRQLNVCLQPQVVHAKGKTRITHNCRPLATGVTKTSRFPHSQSPLVIHRWAAAQAAIVKLDLLKAFHSVPLAEDQRRFYGFIVLHNAPQWSTSSTMVHNAIREHAPERWSTIQQCNCAGTRV